MDKKISQLTAASTPLTGTEELAIVQSGSTVKATAQDVADLAPPTIVIAGTGLNSTLRDGTDNVASGEYSTAFGTVNSATGFSSTIAGGDGNLATAGRATIVGGSANEITLNSEYSFIGGGGFNRVSSMGSAILGGFGAVTTRYGQRSWSSGTFADFGDSQQIDLVARTKTTNAAPTTLWLDGFDDRITIASGFALFATISIAGIRSNGASAAHYIRKVAIKNVGGTTSLIGTVSTIGTDVEDNAAYDVTITADDTNDALDIKVTGVVGETIRWTAHIQGVEIKYGA
jgi:hypothetical protein